MESKIIDVEDTIKRYLEKTNANNIEEVLYYKIDEFGDVVEKEGYAVKNYFTTTSRNSIIFLDKASTDLSNMKVTISKRSGEVYRNSIWFPITEGTKKELLLKAIELFKEAKSQQLVKLKYQVNDIKNTINRLDKLKLYYEKNLEEE